MYKLTQPRGPVQRAARPSPFVTKLYLSPDESAKPLSVKPRRPGSELYAVGVPGPRLGSCMDSEDELPPKGAVLGSVRGQSSLQNSFRPMCDKGEVQLQTQANVSASLTPMRENLVGRIQPEAAANVKTSGRQSIRDAVLLPVLGSQRQPTPREVSLVGSMRIPKNRKQERNSTVVGAGMEFKPFPGVQSASAAVDD